ncbi:kinesin-like nuclear fusion protein [Actinomortierella ambigua]|uniref:Kinesin-like nuclear fusion protein n=1 Tax=Actinomortierella ambigua TaxID=1343610 RepID=A0A9P6Q9G8_9FUNG|nr:kinesin-like nuclear fusion protein [Actinomortierella ambigua]
MENNETKNPELNRSISKLRQPTTFARSASSTAISAAVAVAKAAGEQVDIPSEPKRPLSSSTNNNHGTSTVLGVKREAEQRAINKRAKVVHEPEKKTVGAPSRPLVTTTRAPPATRTGATVSTRSTATAPKPPVGRVNRPTTTTVSTTRSSVAAQRSTNMTSTAQRRAGTPATTSSARTTTTSSRTVTSSRTTSTSSRASSRGSSVQPQSAPETASAPPSGSTPSSTTIGGASGGDLDTVFELPKKKKRPAWDTKGRLEDMEELTSIMRQHLQTSNSNQSEMKNMLASSESKIAELETFRKSLESKVQVKETENQDILRKMQNVEHDLQLTARRHEDEIRSLKSQHSMEVEQLKMTQARLKEETERIEAKLKATNLQLEQQQMDNVQLRATISTQSSNCLALESDNRALKMKIERTENTLAQREATIEDLEKQLAASQATVQDLEQKIRNEETIRRRLHNTIQELKGNIRVFCRVRPILSPSDTTSPTSKAETTSAVIRYPDQEGREIEFSQASETITGTQVSKTYPFTFDKVFQPASTQEDVFEEISQLVQSALDGYNVCIFAYGQTGSGKTFTMEGPPNAGDKDIGMIPRSVMQVYENAKRLEDKGWKYTMEGQYVEIYNETINDLLGNPGDTGKKYEIRHGPSGKTTITDITTTVLTTPAKVEALLKKAAQNRAFASTNMNERSSRSHCVFTLRLSGTNSITDESSEGILNLIDLAGSERLSQSGATGDRLRETQAINKSLSCLGDVIQAISNKDSHVPYRNSKLTYLLQHSLGGNSKTLMFVNISPLLSNFNETLCSLRFATKVNACTIGTATKRAVKSSAASNGTLGSSISSS